MTNVAEVLRYLLKARRRNWYDWTNGAGNGGVREPRTRRAVRSDPPAGCFEVGAEWNQDQDVWVFWVSSRTLHLLKSPLLAVPGGVHGVRQLPEGGPQGRVAMPTVRHDLLNL